MNEAHARDDAERLANERAARARIDEQHAKRSASELHDALADCSSRINEDGQAMRHASLICAIEEHVERSTNVASTALAAQQTIVAPSLPASLPTRAELKRRHEERIAECIRAVAVEQPSGERSKPLTAEEVIDIARKRHSRAPVVIHPTSVEPHPDPPPPLCFERERIRMEQENSK